MTDAENNDAWNLTRRSFLTTTAATLVGLTLGATQFVGNLHRKLTHLLTVNGSTDRISETSGSIQSTEF